MSTIESKNNFNNKRGEINWPKPGNSYFGTIGTGVYFGEEEARKNLEAIRKQKVKREESETNPIEKPRLAVNFKKFPFGFYSGVIKLTENTFEDLIKS